VIIDYCLIESDDADELTRRVKERMQDGWQPLGGIAVTRYTYQTYTDGKQSSWWYTQAMVKHAHQP